MTIEWRKTPESLLDKVELDRVNKTIGLLKIEDAFAIDSYVMSANGPVLSSVYLANEDFLFEVGLTSKHLEFDVCAVKRVINYRVTFGEQMMAVEPPAEPLPNAAVEPAQSKIMPFVTVTLRHTDALATNISYFGEDAESWLLFVLNAYPPSSLLPT